MQRWGVLAAILSSTLGGTTIVATRYLAGSVSPEMLGTLRFGMAGFLMLPLAMRQSRARLAPRELARLIALGLLCFTAQPLLFNTSLLYTTAPRAALAMSTMPLLTMLLAAAVGVERLTLRRSFGVLLAMGGVALALLAGLSSAPPDAWLGDLIMLGSASAMAIFNIACRPLVGKVGVAPFTSSCMLLGVLVMEVLAGSGGGFALLAGFSSDTWTAIVYLGVVGGVGTFLLWSFALKHASPTLVTVSVTLNPVVASLAGVFWLDEPVGPEQLVGLVAVGCGIWLTASRGRVRMPA